MVQSRVVLVRVLAAPLVVEVDEGIDVCAAVDDNEELVPVERLLLVLGVLVCIVLVVATLVLVLVCKPFVDAVLVCKLVVDAVLVCKLVVEL